MANATSSVSVGILVVGRARPGFDQPWGKQIERAVRNAAGKLPWAVHYPSAAATDDASLRRAVAELKQAGCLGLIVIQPTMGDGRLVPTLAQLWGDPIVLWATTERPDSDRVSACTLVGTHAFASLLRQLNHPFEVVNGHPGDQLTMQQLEASLQLTLTRARLHRARVGLIGAHAPGFLNMQVDLTMIQRQLGASMHHITITELIDAVKSADAESVKADRKIIESLNLPHDGDLPEEAFELSSRYILAIQKLVAEQHLDALAVRCWPELPNALDVWPYLAFSRLFDDGMALAMEGDTDGALTLLLGKWMGFGVGYLSDWLAHDQHSLTLWHQGEAPLSICDRATASLGRHFNNNKPIVINAQLAADRPITLARLWHCDGCYRLMAVDVHTAAVAHPLKGTCGTAVFESLDVRQWFDHLCHEGMPHHLALFQNHHAAELRRLARQLDIQWIGN